ncbi:hypothetical protein PVL30_000516 [Lodderomyces elongisporus]|uniref:uncharacterized protein n=1 Tax=Lodderomyces elongisporus TaxID=36914 RepID=UPI002924C5F5|nr:uncharacterized protein PVL30_000516 [Lodderomyces elongisporus]WLF76812.1 hypothetical protein PVL30_000516 [Lodderomyces elongisporus]
MTVQELEDEISAIVSIYPDSVTHELPQIYAFSVPNHESISFQLNFPILYPDEKPQLLQLIVKNENTSEGRKFTDTVYLEKKIQGALDETFQPGLVVIFELLTRLQEIFDEYVKERDQMEAQNQTAMRNTGKASIVTSGESRREEEDEEQSIGLQEGQSRSSNNSNNYTEGWFASEPIVDRHSTFIAYVRVANTLDEARGYLDTLLCDRKIAKATHNISSWRIQNKDSGTRYQDFDDDGETAAGGRLLHLLQMMDVWNVIVVVSRWFGGIHLGPDRFKHINSAARDAITRSGLFLLQDGTHSGNGGGTKSKKK